MFSTFRFSISAALVLFAATGRAARAAPIGTGTDEVRVSSSSAMSEISEAGNPDSLDYRDRAVSAHSPTNEEINAAETASPDSIDNKDEPSRSSENWQAAWQAAESEHPDFG